MPGLIAGIGGLVPANYTGTEALMPGAAVLGVHAETRQGGVP